MIKQRVNRVYHVGILYFYMYIKDKESDKMILTNPKKIDDDLAMELYKVSNLELTI